MLRIITHIERLLLTHDCVILPKFGGFVLQTLPATYQEEEHLFRSMRKGYVQCHATAYRRLALRVVYADVWR